MARKITISVRTQDEWLLETVNDIVKTKKLMGLPSSFSYEFVRLAKNGLTGNLIGQRLDQKILSGE
jgi:hypothetical protein